MMFKKTIFVTVLSLLTVSSFNQAFAQNKAPVLGGFLAAACGAAAYNNVKDHRGWATGAAALFCGVMGWAIGKEMDESSTNNLTACMNSNNTVCKMTTSNGQIITVTRTSVNGLSCYKTAPFVTPMGVKNCVCYENGGWVTTMIQDSQGNDISSLEARAQEVDRRTDRLLRTSTVRSSVESSGGSGSSVISSEDEKWILERYGRNRNSNRSDRSSDRNSQNEVAQVDQRYLINGCIVTDAFLDAPYAFTDDVCRQYISYSSYQDAKSLCTGQDSYGNWDVNYRQKASATPSSCRSK